MKRSFIWILLIFSLLAIQPRLCRTSAFSGVPPQKINGEEREDPMNVNSSGGGYFYGPFQSMQTFTYLDITPNPAGLSIYGAWKHNAPIPILTGKGRWIEIDFYPSAYGASYLAQIGIGPAGSEQVFLQGTSVIPAFAMAWDNTPGLIVWPVPMRFSFPTSVGNGKDLSIRCASNAAGAPVINAVMYVFN